MSRITKALDKLRTKCTEAGTHPSGRGTADILECIAEHYQGGGGGGGDEAVIFEATVAYNESTEKYVVTPAVGVDWWKTLTDAIEADKTVKAKIIETDSNVSYEYDLCLSSRKIGEDVKQHINFGGTTDGAKQTVLNIVNEGGNISYNFETVKMAENAAEKVVYFATPNEDFSTATITDKDGKSVTLHDVQDDIQAGKIISVEVAAPNDVILFMDLLIKGENGVSFKGFTGHPVTGKWCMLVAEMMSSGNTATVEMIQIEPDSGE